MSVDPRIAVEAAVAQPVPVAAGPGDPGSHVTPVRAATPHRRGVAPARGIVLPAGLLAGPVVGPAALGNAEASSTPVAIDTVPGAAARAKDDGGTPLGRRPLAGTLAVVRTAGASGRIGHRAADPPRGVGGIPDNRRRATTRRAVVRPRGVDPKGRRKVVPGGRTGRVRRVVALRAGPAENVSARPADPAPREGKGRSPIRAHSAAGPSAGRLPGSPAVGRWRAEDLPVARTAAVGTVRAR